MRICFDGKKGDWTGSTSAIYDGPDFDPDYDYMNDPNKYGNFLNEFIYKSFNDNNPQAFNQMMNNGNGNKKHTMTEHVLAGDNSTYTTGLNTNYNDLVLDGINDMMNEQLDLKHRWFGYCKMKAINFIRQRFIDISTRHGRSVGRNLFIHITCATQYHQVTDVFSHCVRHIVLLNLVKSGLLGTDGYNLGRSFGPTGGSGGSINGGIGGGGLGGSGMGIAPSIANATVMPIRNDSNQYSVPYEETDINDTQMFSPQQLQYQKQQEQQQREQQQKQQKQQQQRQNIGHVKNNSQTNTTSEIISPNVDKNTIVETENGTYQHKEISKLNEESITSPPVGNEESRTMTADNPMVLATSGSLTNDAPNLLNS